MNAIPRVGLLDYYGRAFTANDVRVVEAEISEETSQSQPKTLSPDQLPPLYKVRESILSKVQKFQTRTPNGLGTAIEKPPGTESAPPPPTRTPGIGLKQRLDNGTPFPEIRPIPMLRVELAVNTGSWQKFIRTPGYMIIKSRNIIRYDVPSADSDSRQITEPAFEISRDCFLRSNSDFEYHAPLQ